MTKITQKSRLKVEDSRCRFHRAFTTKSEQWSEQLIESLKQLKGIEPRKEWAILLKSQILAEKQAEAVVSAQKVSIFDVISNWNRLLHSCNSAELSKFQISNSFSRRLAYAFAVVFFLIIGVFGFAEYTMPGDLLFPIKKIAEQSQASLTGQTALQQDVANLSSRINDLAQVAKDGRKDNIPSAISEINANVSVLAKSLRDNPVNDPQTIKDIANSLKTLADVPGTDLSGNPDVRGLYQTIVQSQIADLGKTTLTDDQKNALAEAEDLYNQGKYIDALEKILLINDTNSFNNNI